MNLKEPVLAFAARLQAGERRIPLADLARLFGAEPDVLARVESRGDLVFRDETFSNDGPEMVVPAGRVEIEVPSLLRGEWTSAPGAFALRFPDEDYTLRACAKIAILRKCFALKELRANEQELLVDFGNPLADRRYRF